MSFNYAADHKSSHADAAPKNIAFEALLGQTVAIAGAMGAGKSSLLQLLARFYDASGGRVLVDGPDVRDLSEPTLRGGVAIARQ